MLKMKKLQFSQGSVAISEIIYRFFSGCFAFVFFICYRKNARKGSSFFKKDGFELNLHYITIEPSKFGISVNRNFNRRVSGLSGLAP